VTLSASPDTGETYLTFRSGTERFALPLAAVREILRLPAIIQVPLAPPSLEGLANLRGAVTAVISLRRLIGRGDASVPDEGAVGGAARLILIDGGAPVGLHIDGINGLRSIPAGKVEPPTNLKSTVPAELLSGMMPGGDGEGGLLLLDPERVLDAAFSQGARPRARSLSTVAAPGRMEPETAVQSSFLLSFDIAGEEYGLPIGGIGEVVNLPASMTRVPNAQNHVLGVVSLRGRLVPLLSLSAMLGLGAALPDPRSKVLILGLEDRAAVGLAVGLVVDRVRDIVRVPRSAMDPVPPLLLREGVNEVEAICRLENGARLISLLSVERLLRHEDVRRALPEMATEEKEEETLEPEADAAGGVEPFVLFRVGPEEYGLPIGAVEEIVRMPEQLTRVPKAPKLIEGVLNLRGALLPVLDQRRRFDLPVQGRDARQRVVVISVDGVRFGLIVDAVTEVVRIPRAVIGPAPELSAEQARLIGRVASLGARMVLLLDPAHLVDQSEASRIAELSRHAPA